METIYIIVEANAYDGYNAPRDEFYLTEAEAITEAKRLNKEAGHRKDYFDVFELTLKK